MDAKCTHIDSSKQQLLTDMDDLNTELDGSKRKSCILERRAYNFDKVILEWKSKADELRLELELSLIHI